MGLIKNIALILGAFLATAYSLHLAQKWAAGLQWETLLQVGLAILGMAFIMWVISKLGNQGTFIKAAAIVGIICGAILAASAGIWALAEASQLWNEHTWEAAGLMFLAVIGFGGMMLTISKMGNMGTYIKSAAVLAILCGAIIAAAAGIWVLAEASQRWTKHTWEAAGLMFLTVIGFGGLAVILGMPPIAAFAAIGCAILLLLTGTIVVAALGLGVLLEQARPWNKTTAKSAEYMFDVIKQFAEMAVVLGIPPISIFAAIGVPVLLLLTGGIMAAAAGLGTLAETATTWDKNVKQSAEYMFDVIKQFAELAVILGTPPISIFAAVGVPILLMLSGAIITASTGLIMLATVAKMIDDEAVKGAQKLGALITNLFDSLDQLPSVFTLGKLMLKIPMFLAVSAGLSAAISLIAAGVQDVANMKVATQWDSEGKPVEYRQLNDKDFELAAKNIKSIVTTIGGAIMDLYKADVDNGTRMFEDAWFGDAPFVVVTQSCSKLGEMISKIAKGVA